MAIQPGKQLFFLILLSFTSHLCCANELLWQCNPGAAELNILYPELVREEHDSNQTLLGEGSDGEVYISWPSSPTASPVAIKRFGADRASAVEIHNEYWIGHSLSHPHIGRSHALRYVTVENPETLESENHNGDGGGFWELEMEYVPFPLLDILDYDVWASRRWSFDATTCVLRQIATALAYMHSAGLAHRDLKVENLMVARDGTVKIIDFGTTASSRDLLSGRRILSPENWVGTPIIMAPEVHGERFYDMEASDVWALGVIFLRIWLGFYPWEPEARLGALWEHQGFLAFARGRENVQSCMDGDADGEDPKLLCQIPGVARSIVADMLELDPARRITIGKLLASPWMGAESCVQCGI